MPKEEQAANYTLLNGPARHTDPLEQLVPQALTGLNYLSVVVRTHRHQFGTTSTVGSEALQQ